MTKNSTEISLEDQDIAFSDINTNRQRSVRHLSVRHRSVHHRPVHHKRYGTFLKSGGTKMPQRPLKACSNVVISTKLRFIILRISSFCQTQLDFSFKGLMRNVYICVSPSIVSS